MNRDSAYANSVDDNGWHPVPDLTGRTSPRDTDVPTPRVEQIPWVALILGAGGLLLHLVILAHILLPGLPTIESAGDLRVVNTLIGITFEITATLLSAVFYGQNPARRNWLVALGIAVIVLPLVFVGVCIAALFILNPKMPYGLDC